MSPALLRRDLEKWIPHPGDRLDSSELYLSRPLLFEPQTKPMPGRLYISGEVPPDDLALPYTSLLLYLTAAPHPSGAERTVNVVADFPLSHLFNLVQDLFDSYEQWDEDLRMLADFGMGVDAMLDSCAVKLRNPVFLHTSDFLIISHSTKASSIDFANSTEFNDLINVFKKDGSFLQLKNHREAFIIPARITGSQWMCQNFFDASSDFTFRMVCVGENNAFDNADMSIFMHFAEYVGREIKKTGLKSQLALLNKSTDRLRVLMKEVVFQNYHNLQNVSHSLEPFGWNTTHSYCVFSFHVTTSDIANNTFRVLCSQLEHLMPDSCAFEVGEELVAVSNMTKHGMSIDDLLHQIVYFVRDNFLKVGVSNVSLSLGGLHDYYQQSQIALQYTCSGSSSLWIAKFDNIAIHYILENCKGALPYVMVCSEKIMAMRAYDEAHSTEFYRTLKVFLQNQFNALQSSRELFIHRSTFIYRMERIRNQFHVNLDDPQSLLHVMITMQLLDEEETHPE